MRELELVIGRMREITSASARMADALRSRFAHLDLIGFGIFDVIPDPAAFTTNNCNLIICKLINLILN